MLQLAVKAEHEIQHLTQVIVGQVREIARLVSIQRALEEMVAALPAEKAALEAKVAELEAKLEASEVPLLGNYPNAH